MTFDIAKLLEYLSKLPAVDDESEWLASNPARLVMRVDHAIVEIAEFQEHPNGAYALGRRPLDCAMAVAALLNACGPGGGGLLERHAMLEELEDYADHRPHCTYTPGAPCDCGLDELRAKLRASEALPPGKGET